MFGQVINNEVVVDFGIDKAYGALLASINSLSGYKIKSESALTHSISVSVGVSMFTWGENMMIALRETDNNKTAIAFSSQSKLGTEFASNSKNRKNIDTIIKALENHLK